MQHIPDKEFDNLFRDKFRDAEITPSANLWANIEQQLAPKRKRTFPIYWMAAATVAIAFTAMLVFQKKEVIQLHGAADPIANVTKAAEQDEVMTTMIAVEPKEMANTEIRLVRRAVKTQKINTVENNLPKNDLKNIEEVMQPNTQTVRLPIKQQDPKPIDVLPITERPVENPVVIAQVAPQKIEDHTISEIDDDSEHKGIRNVGDLVNFVVDKVDKRENKFLKFNTDDDDNSSLVGINIGFLKFNSKKHK